MSNAASNHAASSGTCLSYFDPASEETGSGRVTQILSRDPTPADPAYPGSVTRAVQQAAKGVQIDNEALFDAVVQELTGRATAYIRRFPRLGHLVEADELVSTFCIRLMTTLATAPINDRRHFFALASQNFKWILLDLLKSRSGGTVLGDDQPAPAPGPGTEVARRLDVARMFEFIDQLEPSSREILDLKVLHGLSFTQIAAEMDMPRATVHLRYQQAIAALRTEFAGSEGVA